MMQWVSTISEARSMQDAIDAIEARLRANLKENIDLAILFVSPYFQNDYDKLVKQVYSQLGCAVLVGCSAGGIIGEGREIERRPAIGVLAGTLPGVGVQPFHLDQSDLPDLDASPTRWKSCFGMETAELPHFVILADPYTLDVERGLQGLDYAYPNSVKVGGLASGGEGTGQTALFVNGNRYRSGMVGIRLSGKIEIDTIVAQGCRPIGKPFSITKSDRNMVVEIDHQKPIDVLQGLYQSLPEADQELMQHSLFIGMAITPFKENLERGDFLIRNLMGLDPKTGALALATLPHEGQTGQFHVRDKETSAEDLKWYLNQYQLDKKEGSVSGALMFSCMGRGAHLYGEPDFDSRLFQSVMGRVPMGGFFCNGEIGVVGQSTFLHGYTSCFGLFRPT
jgi:small ligand-binding sensory domain FIST